MDKIRLIAVDRDAARRLFAARGSDDLTAVVQRVEEAAPPDHFLEECFDRLLEPKGQLARAEDVEFPAARELVSGGNPLADATGSCRVRMVRPDLLPHTLAELRAMQAQLSDADIEPGATSRLLEELISLVELAVSNGHCIVSRAEL